MFWATEQDLANLDVIAAAGLTAEAAIRAALARMAVDCAPVAMALAAGNGPITP